MAPSRWLDGCPPTASGQKKIEDSIFSFFLVVRHVEDCAICQQKTRSGLPPLAVAMTGEAPLTPNSRPHRCSGLMSRWITWWRAYWRGPASGPWRRAHGPCSLGSPTRSARRIPLVQEPSRLNTLAEQGGKDHLLASFMYMTWCRGFRG